MTNPSTRIESTLGGWQPIESAPKDGTWILLTGGETTEEIYGEQDLLVARRPVVAFWSDHDPGVDHYTNWRFCFWDGAWRDGYDDPTHWLPLPPPPGEQPSVIEG